MLTSMVDSEKVTNAAGQKTIIYCISATLPCCSWYHAGFICSVGTIMVDSRLREILSSAFTVSDNMLLGKKFPQEHLDLLPLSFLEDMLKKWFRMMRRNAGSLSCVKEVSLQNIGLKTLSNLCFWCCCMWVLKRKENLVYTCMPGNKWWLIFCCRAF